MSNAVLSRRAKLLIAVLLLSVLIVITTCTVTRLHLFTHSDIMIFDKTGSKWISEDQSIAFTVFHEMWYWSYNENEEKVESKRYIGFGTMLLNGEYKDISCILGNKTILLSERGCDANYVARSPEIDVKLNIKDVSETAVTATVQHVFSGQDYFSVGQEISFIRTNETGSDNMSEYEFYVDGIQIVNSTANESEIDVYESLDDLKHSKLNRE